MHYSSDAIRKQAARFERRIRRRNLREYAAAAVVIVMFGLGAWDTPQLVPRISFALLVPGALFYAWHLRRWGSSRPLPAALGSAGSLQHYRQELARQRDLLRGVWWWLLGPIVPGLALFAVYNVAAAPAADRWLHLGFAIAEALFLAWVVWINLQASRRLDRRLAELESV